MKQFATLLAISVLISEAAVSSSYTYETAYKIFAGFISFVSFIFFARFISFAGFIFFARLQRFIPPTMPECRLLATGIFQCSQKSQPTIHFKPDKHGQRATSRLRARRSCLQSRTRSRLSSEVLRVANISGVLLFMTMSGFTVALALFFSDCVNGGRRVSPMARCNAGRRASRVKSSTVNVGRPMTNRLVSCVHPPWKGQHMSHR